ncbi:threonine/homoserine/homoserine lactone efflux protein [Maritalea mobilis]|uniref:Threonine/homoserine/homoserine lactone efflux protein n=1 Tax=Maritalea mobilis TaxID=483324 RepID=A0A4R6VJU6_9HYPH|nr:LysE family translocator [Maritalea mobilis]TDQ63665.1 threonine/homoserine/homoserine lactone efflux protein [Maritalea mobilis]
MLIGFIIAVILITIVPGPSILLLLVVSLRQGTLAGLKFTLGVLAADAVLLTISLLGLGAVLQGSAMLFSIVKWAGVAYLIYLGIKQLRAPSEIKLETNQKVQAPFTQGFAITALNPKAIGFFVAFFPQFIDHRADVIAQLMVLVPLFMSLVFGIFAICAILAGYSRMLFENHAGQITLKYGAALGLISSGLAAAFVQKA